MTDDSQRIGQDEIERLLQQAQSGPPRTAKPAAPPGEPPASAAAAQLGQQDIEALLGQTGKPPAAKSNEEDPAKLLGQADIEALLQKNTGPAKRPAAQAPTAAAVAADDSGVAPQDVELLLKQAQDALASIDSGTKQALPDGVRSFKFEEFAGASPTEEQATLDLIRDVELDLKIELGRTHMHLQDVLKLRKGAVVPLDKLAGDPVDIYVNGRLIARGEVLVLNDNFCVRVAELVAGEMARAG
ncbi:MAG: flagellar motor switch protein FliN [Pirellulales bacterium]|nr:flagellar motor switch protein FliN [Pirellulales bacterium]